MLYAQTEYESYSSSSLISYTSVAPYLPSSIRIGANLPIYGFPSHMFCDPFPTTKHQRELFRISLYSQEPNVTTSSNNAATSGSRNDNVRPK